MKENFVWAQAMKIQDDQLFRWQTEYKGKSLLQWALLQQKVDQGLYLTWARNHYNAISVQDSFFANLPQTKIDTSSLKNIIDWDSSCCPIYQWEEVIFIGCLEPRLELKLNDQSVKIQWVLCSAQTLADFWTKQQISGQKDSDTEPSIPIKIDFGSLADTSESSELSQSISISESAISFSDNLETPATDQIDEDNVVSIEVSRTDLAAAALEKAQTNPWSEDLFSQMDHFFDAKMIVTKMDEGFAPRFWNEQWKLKSSQNTPFINVNQPNIFRIAHNSKKPFHGQVSMNPINEGFFEFWMSSEVPEEITVQPILQGHDVIGMIVATPKDKNHLHQKLQLLNNLSQKASEQLAPPAA